MTARIDTHRHLMPPAYRRMLDDRGLTAGVGHPGLVTGIGDRPHGPLGNRNRDPLPECSLPDIDGSGSRSDGSSTNSTQMVWCWYRMPRENASATMISSRPGRSWTAAPQFNPGIAPADRWIAL